MAMKNRIAVKILGQDHFLISTDEAGYVEKVAKLVDDRMQVVFKSNSSLSHTKVAVLTALNLADDLTKARRTIEELETHVRPPGEEISATNDHITLLIDQIEESEQKYQTVMTQLEEMSRMRGQDKLEMDELLKLIRRACGQEDTSEELLEAQEKIKQLEARLQARESEIEEYVKVFDAIEAEQLQALEEEIIYEEELEE